MMNRPSIRLPAPEPSFEASTIRSHNRETAEGGAGDDDMSRVKANPETLSDVGNRMLTSSRDLTESGAAVGEQGTFDRACLGQAAVG